MFAFEHVSVCVQDVCVPNCVSVCVFLAVCECETKCTLESLCMHTLHPVYLQNFPGGQGKHSFSSCSPPWFE